VEVWARFLRAARPAEAVVRLGVPPKDVARLMAQPVLTQQTRIVTDLANGQVYVPAAAPGEVNALRQEARALGGYAIVVRAPDAPAGRGERWGYAPDSLDLMRRLKAAWDPRGLLNPGVFIV